MINLDILQFIVTGVLAIYVIGALYYMVVIVTYMIRRKRNTEVSWLVDALSRLVVIIDVTFFWPVNLVLR